MENAKGCFFAIIGIAIFIGLIMFLDKYGELLWDIGATIFSLVIALGAGAWAAQNYADNNYNEKTKDFKFQSIKIFRFILVTVIVFVLAMFASAFIKTIAKDNNDSRINYENGE